MAVLEVVKLWFLCVSTLFMSLSLELGAGPHSRYSVSCWVTEESHYMQCGLTQKLRVSVDTERSLECSWVRKQTHVCVGIEYQRESALQMVERRISQQVGSGQLFGEKWKFVSIPFMETNFRWIGKSHCKETWSVEESSHTLPSSWHRELAKQDMRLRNHWIWRS